MKDPRILLAAASAQVAGYAAATEAMGLGKAPGAVLGSAGIALRAVGVDGPMVKLINLPGNIIGTVLQQEEFEQQ